MVYEYNVEAETGSDYGREDQRLANSNRYIKTLTMIIKNQMSSVATTRLDNERGTINLKSMIMTLSNISS